MKKKEKNDENQILENENSNKEENTESENTESVELTEEEKLKLKIEELEAKLAESQNNYLKELAEVQNFKKRVNDERINERKYATSGIIQKLLSVSDNFDRCLTASNYDSIDDFKKGVELISTQFNQILEQEGLVLMEVVGKEFDPNLHQAILTDSVDHEENNIVLEELQKGYLHKDRMIRPAMVKVNQK